MDPHQHSTPAFAQIETQPGACRRGVHGVKRHAKKIAETNPMCPLPAIPHPQNKPKANPIKPNFLRSQHGCFAANGFALARARKRCVLTKRRRSQAPRCSRLIPHPTESRYCALGASPGLSNLRAAPSRVLTPRPKRPSTSLTWNVVPD